MRILTRYILREVVSHAAIGAAIFTFILFTKDLGHILELVVRNSAPLGSVLEVIGLSLPLAFTITIPAGVLVGILIGLSRLAADSEITAMRASGVGVWTFLRILAIFVLGAWLLSLVNGVYLAPASQAALARMQDRLKTAQASFEVQPRVFYEGFPKIVLYVQDVHGGTRAAVWKGVFLADNSTPGSPRIWQAEQGILVSEGPTRLHLHLTNGSTHETDAKEPDHYQISSFQQTDIPIEIPAAEKADVEPVPVSEMSTRALLDAARSAPPATARWYLIEFHRRLALPAACVVLALVGIPLGLSSKKGGKSSGFVLAIGLVFLYYSASLIGLSLARQGRVSPGFGVWLADLVFLFGGAFLLWRAERRPLEVGQWLAEESFSLQALRSTRHWQPGKRLGSCLRTSLVPLAADGSRLSHHSRRLRPTRLLRLPGHDHGDVPDPDVGLHAFRTAHGHHAQSHFGVGGGRLPAECLPLLHLQPDAIRRAAGSAGDLRTDGALQRSHRHQGNRHKHLQDHCPRARDLLGHGGQPVLLRSVLPAARQQAAGRSAQPDQGQACADLPAPRPQVDLRQH
jgi:LPS export ABC transporter permease LptF